MTAIAKVYYRSIKRGSRRFADIPAAVKPDVRALAIAEVASGELSVEEYEQLAGELYPED